MAAAHRSTCQSTHVCMPFHPSIHPSISPCTRREACAYLGHRELEGRLLGVRVVGVVLPRLPQTHRQMSKEGSKAGGEGRRPACLLPAACLWHRWVGRWVGGWSSCGWCGGAAYVLLVPLLDLGGQQRLGTRHLLRTAASDADLATTTTTTSTDPGNHDSAPLPGLPPSSSSSCCC